MPWNGNNFETPPHLEKVLRKRHFTSIHVQEFEVTARDTKLGPEEITRDIEHREKALKNLDPTASSASVRVKPATSRRQDHPEV